MESISSKMEEFAVKLEENDLISTRVLKLGIFLILGLKMDFDGIAMM